MAVIELKFSTEHKLDSKIAIPLIPSKIDVNKLITDITSDKILFIPFNNSIWAWTENSDNDYVNHIVCTMVQQWKELTGIDNCMCYNSLHDWPEWFPFTDTHPIDSINQHYRYRICLFDDCDETQEQSEDHDYCDWFNYDVTNHRRICNICNRTEDQVHIWPNTWIDFDVTNHSRNCNLDTCNRQQLNAHTWINFTGGNSAVNHRCPTCLGEYVHIWPNWPAFTNTHPSNAANQHYRVRTCSTSGCNQQQNESQNHVWGNWGAWSTSGSNRVRSRACTTCNRSQSESVPIVTYNYTGGAQTYTAPRAGTFQFQVYGAAGGNGGNGGYAIGNYSLSANQVINIYVGGAGNAGATNRSGGWNGGGGVNAAYSDGNNGTGGGGTDIRVGGTALGNRVIVAGGGGGGVGGTISTVGHGGGISGTAATGNASYPGTANGGTQSAGGTGTRANGALGVGGTSARAGGGGGYYGGGVSGGTGYYGGGGSGYTGGVSSGSMSNGSRAGNGAAVITFVG